MTAFVGTTMTEKTFKKQLNEIIHSIHSNQIEKLVSSWLHTITYL